VQLANQDGFMSSSTLLHPRSRGLVSLRSASSHDRPLVEFRFLDSPDDVRDVIKRAADFLVKRRS
jgi:choline dehydrogenase-like flavoprotein